MNNLKLGVEVVSAHDLITKDGHGSSSPCVELHFDGQRFRTSIKERDPNPSWNEFFYFNISEPSYLPNLALEAYVYHIDRATNSKSSLGKVRLPGTSFVPLSEADVLYYPLERTGVFSRARGQLGLKVFLTNDPFVRSADPLPAVGPFGIGPSPIQAPYPQPQTPYSTQYPENTSEQIHTLYHLPGEHYQHPSGAASGNQPVNFAATMAKPEPPRVVGMYSRPSSQQSEEFQLRETNPFLGGGGQKPVSTYDLVEQMHYLFVRVVKARELPAKDVTGSLDPYVEVRLGNYKGVTKHFEKKQNPEWNDVFAFTRERMQSSVLEVIVKDKDVVKDDFVGLVRFDLSDIPTRVPPDSPLAPEWHRLENKKGEKIKGELMLALWIGTQADECFPIALHTDMGMVEPSLATHIRSKVYHAPRLWYVRVNVVEAQDIVIADKSRFPDVLVKVQIGNQTLRTKTVQARTLSPLWNEDLLFVAAEPFEEHLIVSVEDRVAMNKEERIGGVNIPLGSVERRLDDKPINSRWYNLEKHIVGDGEQSKSSEKFSSRIHLRVCLDGGYHVLDESTHYSSDLRPTHKQLWKSSIGLLELGILNAQGLQPMKTRDKKGTSDTYCVAKYGQKWVRTRTIVDNLNPRYNEQYTWEVYDPATVITIGMFDNSLIGEKGSNGNKDAKIGKVRIRLSTLETGRVYTHAYPLLVLHNSGLKKMGELHLAIRFSATSLTNMMFIYSRPLLPKMHYIRPLSIMQTEMLRHQAVQIVAARLSRMEPPLRKEVVEYVSDADSHLWSMRRSKANFFRLMSVFSGLLGVGKWFGEVCSWKNPVTTVLVHVLFVMLALFPELILPTIFLYMFLIGLWNYRFRPRNPPHMNTKISHAEAAHPDELDEEFDSFPTSRSPEVVKMRYDRLRSVAGRIQTVVGDFASQGERFQSLLSWRDPRATGLFLLFCLLAAMVLYITPFQVVAVMAGFYVMRHPRFRHKMPSAPVNFFRRLPARTDSML